MKYVRTKNGITTSDRVTHELTEHICCAGYFRTLDKGASVRIGREWWNFYGSWVDIIDENGTHYSISPDEVKNVTKELPQADTIEELCDEFIYNKQLLYPSYIDPKDTDLIAFRYKIEDEFNYKNHKEIYGAIWTTGEHGEPILKSVAKVKHVSSEGEIEWELL